MAAREGGSVKKLLNAPLAGVRSGHTIFSHTSSSSLSFRWDSHTQPRVGHLRLAVTSERRTAASIHPLTVVRPDVTTFVTLTVQRFWNRRFRFGKGF